MIDARALKAENTRLRAILGKETAANNILSARLAEAEKERDDLHRMHCLDLDALLALEKDLADSRDARAMKELWWKAVAKVDAERIKALTEALEELTARAQSAYDEIGNANRYMVMLGHTVYASRKALAGGESEGEK